MRRIDLFLVAVVLLKSLNAQEEIITGEWNCEVSSSFEEKRNSLVT